MFESDADLSRADWRLLQNGAISLFWSAEVLRETEKELADLSYDIKAVSCVNGWNQFKKEISIHLNWEEQFGYKTWNGNLDALNDGLTGYPFGPRKRSVLSITDFQSLVKSDQRSSHIVLDILESNARDHLLFGNFLIILVQTDDNLFDCSEVGGRKPRWNGREWTNKDRGL